MREIEVYLFLAFFLTGCLEGMLFDLRGAFFPRQRAAALREAVLDLVWGVLAAFLAASVVVFFAGGSLRAFPLAGLVLGFWVERRLFSPAFVPWLRRKISGWREAGRRWYGWLKKKG